MSDVTPFSGEGANVPVNPQANGDEVFKAPLEDFDWAAFEQRQEKIDEALHANDPETLSATVRSLHTDHPDVGVKLNSIHNTTLSGDLKGLNAPLAVMTRTNIDTDIPGFNFNGGVAPRADFAGKSFRGADFVDSILTETDFRGADLSGADFANAALTGADFTGANLAGADFSGAYMVGVHGLSDIETIQRVNLSATRTLVADTETDGSLEEFLASHFGDRRDIETIKRMLDPVPLAEDVTVPRLQTRRNLRGLVARKLIANEVDFSASQLVGARIEDMTASGVQFRNAMLSGAIIMNSVMRGADFVSTWAPGIILEDVDLRGSRLTNANLAGSVLKGVDLREVVGLDEKDTNLEGVVIEDCKLPQGYGYNGYAIERSQKLQRELDS